MVKHFTVPDRTKFPMFWNRTNTEHEQNKNRAKTRINSCENGWGGSCNFVN